jgi:hypothetical protein
MDTARGTPHGPRRVLCWEELNRRTRQVPILHWALSSSFLLPLFPLFPAHNPSSPPYCPYQSPRPNPSFIALVWLHWESLASMPCHANSNGTFFPTLFPAQITKWKIISADLLTAGTVLSPGLNLHVGSPYGPRGPSPSSVSFGFCSPP